MDIETDRQTGFFPSKEEFCRICHLLYQRHLASGVGGNISARAKDGVLLTPTGYSLRDLHPDIVSVVSEGGGLREGNEPTKEAGMHLGTLRRRPDINVVFHLHGPHIIAASALLEPGPSALPPLTPGFVYYAYPLPMIPFMVPGTETLAEAVINQLSPGKASAVLLQNHGLVTVGRNFREALDMAEEIDEAARVYLLTRGKAPAIPDRDIEEIKSL